MKCEIKWMRVCIALLFGLSFSNVVVGNDSKGANNATVTQQIQAKANQEKRFLEKEGNRKTIPHILHFINLEDRPLLDIEKERIRSWQNNHRGWQWKVWTKNNIDNIDLQTKDLFYKVSSTAMKRELLRFEVMYRYGGICLDMNIECLKSFTALLSNCDFFAGTVPENDAVLKVSLLGTKPAHPIIRSTLDKIQRIAQGQFQEKEFNIENVLTQSFQELQGRGTCDLQISAHYFYPVPTEVQSKMIPLSVARKQYLKPDCLAIQLCHKIPEIVVVVPSYNNGISNSNACIKNLESLQKQNWPFFSVIIVDDCSTDNNYELIDHYIREHHLEDRFKVIRNTSRKGALENNYNTISTVPEDKVVANPDGDDPLKTEWALTAVASAYADKSAWMTYGSHEWDTGVQGICKQVPEEVCKKRTFRKVPWIFSQLRTFYAKLFHKIKKEDLFHNGNFYSITQDLAYMFPMLEMASQGHIKYIPDMIYIYNTQNPINDFKKDFNLQIQMDKEIRAKPIYEPIELWE